MCRSPFCVSEVYLPLLAECDHTAPDLTATHHVDTAMPAHLKKFPKVCALPQAHKEMTVNLLQLRWRLDIFWFLPRRDLRCTALKIVSRAVV
ncbi:hypothetical protein MN608_05864 [Microdochium nivale]|nr:hypothetical protein MN608_05864 [Microdochium nivale]